MLAALVTPQTHVQCEPFREALATEQSPCEGQRACCWLLTT